MPVHRPAHGAPLEQSSPVRATSSRGAALARLKWVPVSAATAGAVAVYLNTLHNGFVYDDVNTIVENYSIRALNDLPGILTYSPFRSILNFSYAVDFSWTQLDPFGYHVTNILLHAANVILLYCLGLVLARDAASVRSDATGRAGEEVAPEMVAVVAAAVFAVHPMMTEAVGYLSGRSEVLSTTFVLVSFLAFRRWLLGRSLRALGIGLGAGVLALGSKETAAMLPFLVLMYDRLFVRDSPEARKRRLIRVHLPVVTAIMIGAILRTGRFFSLETSEVPDPLAYALIQLGVFRRYLYLLVAPVSQSLVHPISNVTSILDLGTLAGAAHLIAVAALVVAARRRAPLVSFGFGWFLLLLAPSTSVVPLQELMAEHRVYLASCGFFLAAVSAACGWLPSRAWLRRAAALALTALLAAFAWTTVARNRVWSDAVTLWQDAALKAPDTWVTHYALGEALEQQGRCAEAVDAYRKAIVLIPEEPRAYLRLGRCLVLIGRPGEAIGVWSKVVGRTPASAEARLLLAGVYESMYQDYASALRVCQELRALTADGEAEQAQECIQRNQRRLEAQAKKILPFPIVPK